MEILAVLAHGGERGQSVFNEKALSAAGLLLLFHWWPTFCTNSPRDCHSPMELVVSLLYCKYDDVSEFGAFVTKVKNSLKND